MALTSGCAPGPTLIGGPPGRRPEGDPTSGAGANGPAPTLLVLPDDTAEPILHAIREARARVWLTMYLLTSTEALAALVAAHDAGCEVRVLLESAPYQAESANQPAIARLVAAGIDVRPIRRRVGLVHGKLLLVDGRAAHVMSLNLTTAGLTENREYAVIDTEPSDVAWAERLFAADAINAEPPAAPADPPLHLHLLVSPLDARPRITAAIDGARLTIDLEMEELSDDDVAGHLLAARARGVSVTVVAPAAGRSAASTATLRRLSEGSVTVRIVDRPIIHAKAISIDGFRVYTGSVNLTRASLDENREYGVLLDDPSVAARVRRTIAADAAAGTVFSSQ